MKKHINLYLISLGFLCVIVVIGVSNIKAVIPVVKENFSDQEDYLMEGGNKIEEDYRTSFWKRRDWVNVYGIVQKVLGREMSGNMRFVKTDSGLMDFVTKKSNVEPFAQEMVELKRRLDDRDIPLLYVQMPVREPEGSGEPCVLMRTREYYNEIRDVTDSAGIRCMDETEILSGTNAPSLTEFYFKTDVHTTTKGEIWMANKIAEKLGKEYNICIQNVISEDDESFDKHVHPFVGNLVQSLGEYYVGLDEFEEYIPKKQPQYHLEDLAGTWTAEGCYEDVVMNGYDKGDEDEKYVYWVTNYLRYGTAAYHIENLESDGPSLMFICDSLCYRTLSYLSLECSNITVIDPRFAPMDGTDYIDMAFQNKSYDAVIYLHGTFYTTDYSMFGDWSLIDEK